MERLTLHDDVLSKVLITVHAGGELGAGASLLVVIGLALHDDILTKVLITVHASGEAKLSHVVHVGSLRDALALPVISVVGLETKVRGSAILAGNPGLGGDVPLVAQVRKRQVLVVRVHGLNGPGGRIPVLSGLLVVVEGLALHDN